MCVRVCVCACVRVCVHVCVLYVCCMYVMCVCVVCVVCRIKSSMFQYAGTKDKRAITTQAVTVFRVPAERLASLNRASKNVQVGNFQYVLEGEGEEEGSREREEEKRERDGGRREKGRGRRKDSDVMGSVSAVEKYLCSIRLDCLTRLNRCLCIRK